MSWGYLPHIFEQEDQGVVFAIALFAPLEWRQTRFQKVYEGVSRVGTTHSKLKNVAADS